MTGSPLSKSQVNKAGRVLRKAFGESRTWDERVPWALDVLVAWRAAHQYPLTKSNNGLRSMVRTEGCQVEVSQRLKRVPTIIDKLERHPTMQLATMQDIAGCRAVLASIQELHRVQRRLSKNRPPVHVDDYISQPRASGYRGVHVMVQYDGRTIEVQLRTQVMHSWAVAVERLGGRLRADLKSGQGPPEMLDFLEAVSEAMAIEEAGQQVSPTLMQRIDELRLGAVRLSQEGGSHA